MGMRYRRPNRRIHAPYPREVQLSVLLLALGAALALFTYGISLLLAAVGVVLVCTKPRRA